MTAEGRVLWFCVGFVLALLLTRTPRREQRKPEPLQLADRKLA